jgi:hypothetical protein
VCLVLCAAVLAAVMAVWWRSDPAVHWQIVEERLYHDFGRSDSGTSHDRGWIPFSVLQNPRRQYLDWKRSRIRIAMGFPNMDMGFHDDGTNYHATISVHLFENYARGISISCDSPQKGAEIENLIRQRFPRLPVRLLRAQPHAAGDAALRHSFSLALCGGAPEHHR